MHLNLPCLYCRLPVPVQGIVNFGHIQCFVVFQSTLQQVIAYNNIKLSSPYPIIRSINRYPITTTQTFVIVVFIIVNSVLTVRIIWHRP